MLGSVFEHLFNVELEIGREKPILNSIAGEVARHCRRESVKASVGFPLHTTAPPEASSTQQQPYQAAPQRHHVIANPPNLQPSSRRQDRGTLVGGTSKLTSRSEHRTSNLELRHHPSIDAHDSQPTPRARERPSQFKMAGLPHNSAPSQFPPQLALDRPQP